MNSLYPYSSGGTAPPANMNHGTSVASRHPDYLSMLPAWARIDAVMAGSDGVKAEAKQFLPMTDYDVRNPEQYWAYVTRANFINYTLRTVSALEGLIYRKDPTVKVPKQFEKRLDNIDNRGSNFYVFSKRVAHNLIRYGRVGIMIDYIGEGRDRSDPLQTYPFLALYNAHSIVNWRTKIVNGSMTLDQVVLMEHFHQDREFGAVLAIRYKVLDLENGVYRARTFEPTGSGDFVETDKVYPGRGASWSGINKIPFVIINPVDVSPDMHRPPILDLVDLNLSHFRTSADYESALHVLAQPTAVITGLPEENQTKFQIGGPQIWRLPEGATAAYMEMRADGLSGSERALAMKVEAMREIGAQMLSSAADGPETATSARIRQHSQTSVLSSIAGTCSTGLQRALQIALDWDSITGEAEVELNQDYLESIMAPDMLRELTVTHREGLLTKRDYVYNLQRGELLQPGRNIDEIIDEMEQEPPVLVGRPNGFILAKEASEADQPPQRNGQQPPKKKGGIVNQRPQQFPPRPSQASQKQDGE
jgi:hypothetical protein